MSLNDHISEKTCVHVSKIGMLYPAEYVLNRPISIFPKFRGIYFLISNGEIVYVGQSENIILRIHSHSMGKEKEFDSYNYVLIEGNLDEIELAYILKFRPKYNRSLPKNDLYVSIRELRVIFNNVYPSILNRYIRENKVDMYLDKYKLSQFEDFENWIDEKGISRRYER